jgi:hypothetical protein
MTTQTQHDDDKKVDAWQPFQPKTSMALDILDKMKKILELQARFYKELKVLKPKADKDG